MGHTPVVRLRILGEGSLEEGSEVWGAQTDKEQEFRSLMSMSYVHPQLIGIQELGLNLGLLPLAPDFYFPVLTL